MKETKKVLIAVTAAFVFVLIGVFIGRNSQNHDWILPESIIAENAPESSSESSNNLEKININTATAQQFMILPGIGETLAQRIIDYRQENGNFASVDSLTCIDGIGDKTLEKIRPYLTVGG